jgi:hypothetical protein
MRVKPIKHLHPMGVLSLQFLRSGVAHTRPDPTLMREGELTMNFNSTSKGLFFIDDEGSLVKVGPVEVSNSAPNSSPGGESGNMVGELWYDENTGALKIWHNNQWKKVVQDQAGFSGTFLADTQIVTVVNGIIMEVE